MFKRMQGIGPDTLTVFDDGSAVTARPGDCVASVRLRTPAHLSRKALPSGSRRAPFCLVGVCMECSAVADGVASTQGCQGRQCATAVARLHACASGRPEAAHQTYRVRPPLKPVRMGELAALAAREQTR